MPISLSKLFLAVSPVVAMAHVGWYYLDLPARMASHFGASGAADGWMSRTAFVATYVGLIAFLGLLYNGLAWGLPRFPASMISLPHRDYWLATERREQTLKDVSRQITVIGSAMVLFLMIMFDLCLRANADNTFRLNPTVVTALTALFVAALVFWLGRFIWQFARPAVHSAE